MSASPLAVTLLPRAVARALATSASSTSLFPLVSSAAVISTAVAGVVFALGPGHNIPFLGNTPGVWKGLALLLAIILISSFSLMLGVELLGANR